MDINENKKLAGNNFEWSVKDMRKKTGKSVKIVGPELLSVSCTLILFISFFSFAALAENTNELGKTSNAEKISADLSLKIAGSPANEEIPIVIVLMNQEYPFNTDKGKSQIDRDQKDLIKLLNDAKSKNKAKNIKSLHIVNAVAAEVTPEVITSLAIRSEVSTIELDQIVSIADNQKLPLSTIKAPSTIQKDAWGVDKIGAPAVWQQGITGKGISVAVIDSGIDATHPDLDDLDDNPSTNDPKVVKWKDYVRGKNSPYDDNGHGTHVSGTISGTGANGIHTGVAPGTNLIVAKVFNRQGSGFMSNVILAFEWAVNNNAHVISFSGGGPHSSSFITTIDNVVAAGVIPVIAAGNSGPGASTINCPGDEISSTTVGATDSSDKIASFSSRGPVNFYGSSYIKPDISAPGVSVTSTYLGRTYATMSGTSMATPHVSGTVALMLQKNPALKTSEIKQILEMTAIDILPSGKDNNCGSGRINAYEAVSQATTYLRPLSQ
jgi:serine protease AprX